MPCCEGERFQMPSASQRATRLCMLGAALALAGCPTSSPLDVGPTDDDVAAPLDAPVPDAPLDTPAPSDASDAPELPDAPVLCTTDDECQLEPWCVNRWRCDPERPTADARGCLSLGPPPPCGPGHHCDSTRRACWCPDEDGDGLLPYVCGGIDCNDADPRAPGPPPWPSFYDICDGFDTDCDGLVDENPDRALYPDEDGDGYGVGTGEVFVGCASGDGLALVAGDCDDGDADRYPSAPEICNGLIEDCTSMSARGEDADADGFAPDDATCRGDVPGAFPPRDCFDYAASIGPGRPELCNGRDDDCDPATSDGSAADNGCLPGHACRDGACRQTLSLVAWNDRTCAILTDHTVRCWGPVAVDCALPDIAGYCFEPTTLFGGLPVESLDPTGFLALDPSGALLVSADFAPPPLVAPGRVLGPVASCMARRSDGSLVCEGRDMPGPSDVVQITPQCARTAAGEVWCWGENGTGEVGDGTRIDRPDPVRIIDAGAVALDPHGRCVVMVDGTVRCWGFGVLLPTALVGVSGATEVAHVSWRTWVLRGDADAIILSSTGIEVVPGTAGMHSLVAGLNHTCAIAADGRVVCWLEPDASYRYTPLGVPHLWPAGVSATIGGL